MFQQEVCQYCQSLTNFVDFFVSFDRIRIWRRPFALQIHIAGLIALVFSRLFICELVLNPAFI